MNDSNGKTTDNLDEVLGKLSVIYNELSNM